MIEQELKRKIEESNVLARYLKNMPPMPNYRMDSEEAQTRYIRANAITQENNFRASVLECAFDIASWVSGCGGSFSTWQCKSPEAQKATFINLSFAQLLSSAHDIRQEIGKLKNAKLLLLKLTDTDAKAKWENNFSITLLTANRASSWIEYNWKTHEAKMRGKEAVLDMAIVQNEEILVVYEAEIADRTKSPKIKEIVKNMQSLVKQAEKILPTITKANGNAQKALMQGTRPDLKSCKIFIEGCAEFSELSYEFSALKNQLDYYTHQTPNDVSFPALTSNDTSAAYEIKKEYGRYA
jgi:hypothetical protein